MTRSTLRTVFLVACAALCTGLLSSCGDADDERGSAAATGALEQTFAATSKLDSARLNASFQLEPDGLLALGGPISFRAAGPFASASAGQLPRFDLQIAGALARQDLRARATSTGKDIFLRIDGRDYALGLRPRARGKRHAGLASLGLDPSGWIAAPAERGTATIGGVETTRVTGEIDVERLLDDVAKLLGGADGLLGPRLRAKIEAAVTSAKVDVWTGTSDKILRQLVAVIDFAFKQGESPISGLDGGRATLRLRLDDVNATTVEPRAPKDPRPLSDLLGDGGLGALFSGLGAGALGGSGGDGGDAFLKCLSPGASTADIVECTSKLAP